MAMRNGSIEQDSPLKKSILKMSSFHISDHSNFMVAKEQQKEPRTASKSVYNKRKTITPGL